MNQGNPTASPGPLLFFGAALLLISISHRNPYGFSFAHPGQVCSDDEVWLVLNGVLLDRHGVRLRCSSAHVLLVGLEETLQNGLVLDRVNEHGPALNAPVHVYVAANLAVGVVDVLRIVAELRRLSDLAPGPAPGRERCSVQEVPVLDS